MTIQVHIILMQPICNKEIIGFFLLHTEKNELRKVFQIIYGILFCILSDVEKILKYVEGFK